MWTKILYTLGISSLSMVLFLTVAFANDDGVYHRSDDDRGFLQDVLEDDMNGFSKCDPLEDMCY